MLPTRIAALLTLAAMVAFALMMVLHSYELITGALFDVAAICLAVAAFVMLAYVAVASARQLRRYR